MTSGDAALDFAHPSPDPKPLARVYGEPVNELPHDLYIPPEALASDTPQRAIPPLYGALVKNEQDVHLFEQLVFLQRRGR